jgi:hypothetical protein
LKALIEVKLLPIIGHKDQIYVPIDNVILFSHQLTHIKDTTLSDILYWRASSSSLDFFFNLSTNTDVTMVNTWPQSEPAVYSAIHNLARYSRELKQSDSDEYFEHSLIPGVKIKTKNKKTSEFIKEQIARIESVNKDLKNANLFTHSAYYMGSKRCLGAFIVEAIYSVFPADGVIVDLMCGSGVASNALSTFWPVYASDAMQFCQLLAKIQSSGFTSEEGYTLIEEILPNFKKNCNYSARKSQTYLKV